MPELRIERNSLNAIRYLIEVLSGNCFSVQLDAFYDQATLLDLLDC